MRLVARLGCLALVLAAAPACSKKNPDGLPPSSEWGSGSSGEVPHFTPPPGMGKSATSNPHAGMGATGENPHAGMDMNGADPHAGVDMGGNPHGGGGVDVTKMGLAAPDHNRQIDPTHRIAGTIAVDAKVKDKLKPGTAIFLIVKRAGADGAPSGPPLAVDKLDWAAGGVPFELTDANAMVAGTEFTGDVVVTARYDQDGDALSKEPGDVTGVLRAKIPADKLTLTLDTLLP